MDPITIAMTIDDWDFFLPRAHKNKPVKGRPYRIFEPQWKQVILLWLEREDVEEEKKEEFITALTKLKDGCKHFLPKEKLDRGFYEYRAYFLAAAGISGFGNCSQADEIVKKVVYWVCNQPYSFPYYIVQDEAIKVLVETPRKKTINALVQLLESTSNDDTLIQASEILGKINPGNEKAIHTLVKMLESASDYTLIRAAEILGKINPGNEKAIGVLLEVLESTSDYYTPSQVEKILEKIFGSVDYYKQINSLRMVAAVSLGEIGSGNEKAIDGLVQLLESSSDYHTSMEASKSLGEIGMGNEKAINGLVQLLESNSNDTTPLLAAESLGKIDPSNEKAINALLQFLESSSQYRNQVVKSLGEIAIGNEKAIDALVQVLKSTSSDHIYSEAVESLGKIGTGNEKAINALVQVLESTSNDSTLIQAAESLGKIDPGNQKAINGLVQLLKSTSNNYTLIQAAESLGKIDPGNEKAINGLVQLLRSTSNNYTRISAAESLEKIDPGNEKAIHSLVKVLESSFDDSTWMKAVHSLEEISTENHINKIFTSLKHYLSAIEYFSDLNKDRFSKSYNIIWNFTETLSYPEFYQAWHTPLKKRLWLFLCLRLF